jgi:hypothetical protein
MNKFNIINIIKVVREDVNGIILDVARLCAEKCVPGQFSYRALLGENVDDFDQSLKCCKDDLCNTNDIKNNANKMRINLNLANAALLLTVIFGLNF